MKAHKPDANKRDASPLRNVPDAGVRQRAAQHLRRILVTAAASGAALSLAASCESTTTTSGSGGGSGGSHHGGGGQGGQGGLGGSGGEVSRLMITATVAAFAGSFAGSRLLRSVTLDALQKLVGVMIIGLGAALTLGWI